MSDKIVKAAVTAIDPIDSLVQKAVESGAVDVLERLLVVRQQVHADQARSAFYTALIAFQNACPVIAKSTTATIKPGFSYNYTPIEEIAHAIRPILNEQQLGYRWFTTQDANRLTVTCRISHALGHVEETSLTVPVGVDPQRPAWPVAQSLTYAKRYTLCNALGIVVGGEDDDAQEPAAQPPTQQAASAPPPKAAPAPTPPPSKPTPAPGAISEAQAKRLYAIAKNAGWSDDDIKLCVKSHGYDHTRDILKADYEAICAVLVTGPQSGGNDADLVPF